MAISFDKGLGEDKEDGKITARIVTTSTEVNISGDSANPSLIHQDCLPTLPLPSEEIREEAEEGRHLYIGFLKDEIQRNGLSQPQCMLQDGLALSPERLMDWTRIGRELRQMADAFSRSKEREYVKDRAKEITLDTLNYDHFFLLLHELFQGGGITRERILVLFFFCADVAIEALKKGFHQTFHTLFDWSVKYIATRVAQWVHDQGGWGMVIRSSLALAYQLTACCAFLAVAFACVVYIRRNVN